MYNSRPLVSVLIAAFNEEKYIRRCLVSVIEQTYSNIEIIVIDDGSTDDTFRICEEISRIDNRIRVIHQENQGLPFARKKGLENAKGDYIQFIDADDWCESMRIEHMIDRIITDNTDIVFASAYRHREDGTAIICNLPISEGIYSVSDIRDIYIKPLFGDYKEDSLITTGYLWCCLFKIEMLQNVKFFKDITLHEDEVLLLQALARAKRISVIEEPLYNYNRRMNTLSKKNTYWMGYWNNMQLMFYAKKEIGELFFKDRYEYMPRLCTSLYLKALRSIRNETHYMNPAGFFGGLKNLYSFNMGSVILETYNMINIDQLEIDERILLHFLKHKMFFVPYAYYAKKTHRMRKFHEKTKN